MNHKHQPNGETKWIMNEPSLSIQYAECSCGAPLTRRTAPLGSSYNWENWEVTEVYDPKCCEEQNLHEYSDDCRCCVNTCKYCAEPMENWNPMKEEN
jgi:hypothetical protein